MSNHVHWIATPDRPDSLAKAFGEAHGRYAHYANAKHNRSGHFWQNRFFSCALDPARLWVALRYVERNPVRAGLTRTSQDWPWSSAASHTGSVAAPVWLDCRAWSQAFTPQQWRIFLAAPGLADAEVSLRACTYTGRPLGSHGFVRSAEVSLDRPLAPRKGGRPRKPPLSEVSNPNQDGLFDEA
jgi:putative transposase